MHSKSKEAGRAGPEIGSGRTGSICIRIFARLSGARKTIALHSGNGGITMYYHTCRHCGANLDPGEHCECQKKYNEQNEQKKKNQDKEKDRKQPA